MSRPFLFEEFGEGHAPARDCVSAAQPVSGFGGEDTDVLALTVNRYRTPPRIRDQYNAAARFKLCEGLLRDLRVRVVWGDHLDREVGRTGAVALLPARPLRVGSRLTKAARGEEDRGLALLSTIDSAPRRTRSGRVGASTESLHYSPQFPVFRKAIEGDDSVTAIVLDEIRQVVHHEVHAHGWRR